MEWIGRLLFRKHKRWSRRKEMRSLVLALFLGALISGLIAGAIYWLNIQHRI